MKTRLSHTQPPAALRQLFLRLLEPERGGSRGTIRSRRQPVQPVALGPSTTAALLALARLLLAPALARARSVATARRRERRWLMLPLLLAGLAALALPQRVLAEANYVYHERTSANPGCGAVAYVPVLNPTSAQAYDLRFKVEYQFFTDTARVYYTTDGSTPSGAFGVGAVGTLVVPAAFNCTFGGPVVDVLSATIPAQPAGTVVKYIMSAWHSGGGSEVFANGPGAPCSCGTPTSSSALATVFQYTVGSLTDLYWDSNGSTAGAGATPAGNWGTSGFWSTAFDGTAATGAWVVGRNAVFSAGTDATGDYTVTLSSGQTASGVTVEEGTVSFTGSALTVGTGTVAVNSGAKMSIPNTTNLVAAAGANLNLNGGTFRSTVNGIGLTFVDTDFSINIGSAGGTLETANTGANSSIFAGTIKGPGHTLTKTGSGEFRYQGTGLPNTTFSKLVVNQGLYRLGFASSISDERGFGAVPGSVTADAITLSGGGSIGTSFTAANSVLHVNRGLTLGAGGGAINGSMTIPGPITGSGDFSHLTTGTLVLNGANDYSGNTFVTLGIVQVGSATALGNSVGYTEVASGAEVRFDGATVTFTCAEPFRIAGGGGAGGGAITIQNSSAPILSGPVTLTADATVTISGTASGTFNNPAAFTSLANQNLTLQGGANASGVKAITGVINLGSGGLTKLQGGTWVLSGANTYSGPTTISAGTLRVANTTGSATGSGDVTVASGATLSGPGIIAGSVSVTGTIAAGTSPGTITTGGEIWNGGGTYVWEINDAAGTPGTDPGWDLININGGLMISATPASRFNLNVRSLTLANANGDAVNFNKGQAYVWTIATASGGITGFDPAAFNLGTSTFSNATAGTFSLEQNGNNLQIRYLPAYDFGDSPDPNYPTLLANNGARHLVVPGAPRFGANIDAEPDGQPSVGALGDDSGSPDDEDGVSIISAPLPGQVMPVTVDAPNGGQLDAWIDFNADGDWADSGEQIFTNVTLTAGNNFLNFVTPLNATLGDTHSRFRISTVGALAFDGPANDGEVEDHPLTILAAVDVSVAMTGAPEPVGPGSNLTYSIVVSNAGPNGATGVMLIDTLPPETMFVSASPGCTHNAGVVTCNIGSLSVNASTTLGIVVSVTNCQGSLVNTAAVSANGSDLNVANNTSSSTNTAMDLVPPVITCPASFLVTDSDNSGDEAVTYPEPPATDNCTTATVACTPPSGSVLALGAHTIACTATDGAGNTNSCSFIVVVCATNQPLTYVDDDYAGKPVGTAVNFPDNGTAGPHLIGCDAFATLQAGVNSTAAGGTLQVAAGTYPEFVVIPTSLTLLGNNAGVDPRPPCHGGPARGPESILDGMGTDTAIAFQSGGVTLNGFTIRGGAPGPATLSSGLHLGNGFNDNHVLNNIFTNNAIGVAANCAGPLPTEIRRNLFVANNLAGPSGGSGIYADSTANLFILENEFQGQTDNHPLLLGATAAGSHTNLLVDQNNFHDNVYGLLVLGVNGGTFSRNQFSLLDGTCLAFFGGSSGIDVVSNSFVSLDSSNTRGVRIRDDGYGFGNDTDIEIRGNSFSGFGSIPGNAFAVGIISGYTGILDASANWWDVATPVGVLTKIDDSGGTVDYTPWLVTGVEPVPDVCDGFQGDFSTLIVDAASPQSGVVGRIQEGINLVTSAGTVKIVGGTYGPTESANASANSVTLAPGASPAQVIVNGDMTLDANDTLEFELNGPTPGPDSDQFVVNGNVTLGGAIMSATAVASADCVSLTLIDNDGVDAVSGTFNGLPNGTVITISGQDFKIFYNKGDGNDVVLVKDTIPPSITCAPDQSVACTATWNFTEPTAVDACGTNTISVLVTTTNLGCGGSYVAQRAWLATDACGNSTTCTQTVSVVDTVPPLLTSVTNKTVECGSTWTFDDPTATDACGTNVVTVLDTVTNTISACSYAVERIWQATDACGNSVTCTQAVTVVDTVPPVLAGATNKTVECGSSWTFDDPSAVDACGTNAVAVLDTVTNTLSACSYAVERIWQATDACGNSVTSTQVVSVVDTVPPVLTGVTNKTVECTASWTFDEPSAEDACGTNTVTVLDTTTNFNCGATYVAQRVWQATDACGNSMTSTQTVSVVDTVPPVLTGVSNKTVECTAAWAFDEPSVADACGTNTVTVLDTTTNFNCGATYVAQRVWQATDACGNSTTSTQTVSVVDTVPPVLTSVTNKTAECGDSWSFDEPTATDACGTNAVAVFDTVTNTLSACSYSVERIWQATDACGNSVTCTQAVTVVDTVPPALSGVTNKTVECGDALTFDDPTAVDACGTNAVTVLDTVTNALSACSYAVERIWQAADACGNSVTCTQTVTVVDTVPPVLTGVTNKTVECPTAWTFDEPSAEDACGTNTVTVLDTTTNFNCGATYMAQRVWQATDACGNSVTCTQTVSVVDTVPPVLTGVTNKTVECTAAWTFDEPSAEDACGTNTVTVLDTTTNFNCGATYVAQRVWQATDACGNSSTSTQTVSVVDTVPPELTGVTNKTVECGDNWTFDEPTATDACGTNAVTVFDTVTNTLSACSYAVERIWQATDACGNSVTSTQTVSVADTVPPVLTGVTNKTVECGSSWSFDDPTATDTCSTNALSVLDTVTNALSACSYAVERVWQATDACGNSVTCTQTVSVVDTVPPVLTGVTNKTVECTAAWTFDEPSAEDACGTNTVTVLDTTNFNCGATYVAQRVWQATDACGNSGTFTQTVSVVDTVPPVLTGVTNKTVECTAAWTFDEPSAVDACGTNTLAVFSTTTNFGCGYLAQQVWVATDACGNSSTWTQTVNVVDTTAPQITYCPTNRSLPAGTNCIVLLPDLAAELVASDSCGGILVTQSPPAGSALGLGAHVVNFTVYDTCSNSAACALTLTVVDTTAPAVLPGATNFTVVVGPNCLAEIPDLTGQLTITDCSSYTAAQNPAVGTILGVGDYQLTFHVEDAASNSTLVVSSLVVAPPVGAETNIIISEFMAKNTFTLADEDGTYSDWIEIHNAGPCPVNLNNWCLTDNASLLTKWRFPATNIAGGQYLLVWASDKNRRTPGAPLHTNFKMGDEGEYLALVRPNGTTIATHFSPTFPPQLPDISYGRPANSLIYTQLALATPAAANSGPTNFLVEPLTFRSTRGWYTNFVSVSIHSPSENLPGGVQIYWTTNGSVPSPTNGFLYTQRLYFSNTTILQASAYRPGYAPSPPVSHTYIFPTLVAYQTGAGFPTNWGYMTNFLNQVVPVPAMYTLSSNILNDPQWGGQFVPALLSLPTISIVMKTEDMFGTNGIYSNTFGDGSAWERPCSVEYLRRDSQPGFQVNCGIRIQGGLSRDPAETPKHKLRLLFKPFLNYDLYDGSPVTEFATLSLNAIFNDHWRGGLHNATFLKDQWCADTQDEMHGFGKHGTYVQVYINGLFWGFFDIGERPDGSYGAHYFGGIKAEYDAFSGPDELTDGDWDDFNQMMAIATAGITNATSYSNLSYYLDVPVFIDYLLINFYAGNQDWPENNWRAVSAVARDVPLHFFSWDAEIIFFDLNWNSTFISAGYIGQLYTALLQYPEFRLTFADHAQSLLLNGGLLSPERCTERWQRRAQEIDLAVISESARWGDFGTTQYTKLHWLQAQAPLLTNYFPHRTDILLSQLRARSLYPALEPPTFDPHGGIIPGYLPVTMTAPFGAIYYTTNGTDPRLPDGNVSPDALQYTGGLTLTNGVRLSARTFATNTWSAVVVADYLPLAELNLGFDSIERRHDGSVELRLTGFPGDTYNLQASANLLDWESIAMITPFADGTYTYLDVAAAALPLRFYRLTWP